MALPEITKSTTVGTLRDVAKALTDAKEKTSVPAEKSRLDELINKYTTSANKLITVCKNEIISKNIHGNIDSQIEIARLTRDNFKNLSLDALNNILVDTAKQHETSEIIYEENKRDPGQGMIDFLEGKSGITLMTGIKATLTTAAVAALSSLNIAEFAGAMGLSTTGLPTSFSIISIVPKILSTLAALNPVIGVAAGALLYGAKAIVQNSFDRKDFANAIYNGGPKKK